VAEALERVKLPGLFLMAVGCLNLLAALFQTGGWIYFSLQPAEKMYATQLEQFDKAGENWSFFREMAEQIREKNPEEYKRQRVLIDGLTAAALLAGAVIVLLAGMRMVQLRSYGLCVLGSLLAATPLISPACCCGVGGIVGLWSVFVLLSPVVRLGFFNAQATAPAPLQPPPPAAPGQ
jgi:hypothetical protein